MATMMPATNSGNWAAGSGCSLLMAAGLIVALATAGVGHPAGAEAVVHAGLWALATAFITTTAAGTAAWTIQTAAERRRPLPPEKTPGVSCLQEAGQSDLLTGALPALLLTAVLLAAWNHPQANLGGIHNVLTGGIALGIAALMRRESRAAGR